MTKFANIPNQVTNGSGTRIKSSLFYLVERYGIKRQIGKGAYSVVYEGTQDNAPVIIKVAKDEFLDNSDVREIFSRDVRALQKIKSGAPKLLNWELSRDTCYLTMTKCNGRSLSSFMQDPSFKFLKFEELLTIAKKISHIVNKIHSFGVYHLDLKPNHFYIDDGTIIDFGLSITNLKQNPIPNHGTPSYISPEQIDPEFFGSPSNRSDLYSIGIIFFALFSQGKYPFRVREEGISKIYDCHLKERPYRLDYVSPKIPKIVADIIDNLLEKKPHQRLESVEKLRELLDRI